MKTAIIPFSGIIAFAIATHAAEFHVAVNGKDLHPGTKAAPLRTIQRAANRRADRFDRHPLEQGLDH